MANNNNDNDNTIIPGTRLIGGSLLPSDMSLAPMPSRGWYRLRLAHSALLSKVRLRRPSLADRPPTPSVDYRTISFCLHRQVKPAKADEDEADEGQPSLCAVCQAHEDGVEPPAWTTDRTTNCVRFVDPLDVCRSCGGFLITCYKGKDTSDMETLANSDDEGEDLRADLAVQARHQRTYKPVHNTVVDAPYPPPHLRLEKDFERALNFNLDLACLIRYKLEDQYKQGICDSMCLTPETHAAAALDPRLLVRAEPDEQRRIAFGRVSVQEFGFINRKSLQFGARLE